MTWATVRVGRPPFMELHVVPVEDLRLHEAHACWCRPSEEDDEPGVWLHNALDLREQYEAGRLPS